MITVKERPFRLYQHEVMAVLDGRQTQVRRQFSSRMIRDMELADSMGEVSYFINGYPMHKNDLPYVIEFCPYGKPGDRLWVKEEWWRDQSGGCAGYKADGLCFDGIYGGKWIVASRMPRWASRIDLEIVSVRAERLQDISEEDKKAEGITSGSEWPIQLFSFAELWESINGTGSWGKNPWVWVIEFKRVKTA